MGRSADLTQEPGPLRSDHPEDPYEISTHLDRLRAILEKMNQLEERADNFQPHENPGEIWDTLVDELRSILGELLQADGTWVLVPHFISLAEKERMRGLREQEQKIDVASTEYSRKVAIMEEAGKLGEKELTSMVTWFKKYQRADGR